MLQGILLTVMCHWIYRVERRTRANQKSVKFTRTEASFSEKDKVHVSNLYPFTFFLSLPLLISGIPNKSPHPPTLKLRRETSRLAFNKLITGL